MAYNGLKATFPCGRGGLLGNKNIFTVPIQNLTVARNIRYRGFLWTRAPGLSLFDSSAISGTPSCLAGFDYRPAGVQRQVTVWDNGSVYKEVAGNIDSVTLASGLSFTEPVVLLEAGDIGSGADKELYLFSKGVAPKKLTGDGSSLTAITNESADWSSDKPGAAIYHDARIYAFDVASAAHNFYVSTITDHGDFTGTGAKVFQLQPGIGDRIVCGLSSPFAATRLFLWKYPRGIFEVDTSDVTISYLPSQRIRDDIGGVSPQGAAKVGENVFFISSNGRIYLLNALRPDIDPESADLTAQLGLNDYIKENVDADKLKYARLVYDEPNQELHYVFTSKSGTINDTDIVFDFSDVENGVKASIDDRGEYFNAIWPRIGSDGFTEILTAGENGVVYRANAESRSIAGTTGFVSELRYADTDLRFVNRDLAGKEKRFDFLELTIIPTGNYDITVTITIDGVFYNDYTISVGDNTAVFGTAIFDQDVFGGRTLIKPKIEIDACGDQIGIGISSSGINENFAIANMELFFTPLGDTYEA